MKKLSLSLILLAIIFMSNNSFSQSWLPKPVNSPYIDAIAGEWISAPYEFIGNTATEILTYNTILNGQFLEIEIKRIDNSGFTYSGKEIIKLTEDGTMNGYYFDIFGKERNLTYTVSKEGNEIKIQSSSLVGNGTREIIIDGTNMTQNVTFVIPDDSGNSVAEQKISVSYVKK